MKGRADMTILLLAVLIVTETAFFITEISISSEKREWNKKRSFTDLIELGAFAVMLLLPDIDLSFRFGGLLFILLLRLAFAVIGYLIGRKSDEQKTKIGKTASLLFSVMMFVFALTPAFLFKN